MSALFGGDGITRLRRFLLLHLFINSIPLRLGTFQSLGRRLLACRVPI